MKKDKIKNMSIVILSLLLVVLGGYLSYDKFLVNIDKEIENEGNNKDMYDADFVYDSVKLAEYKNYNGSYGTVEKMMFSDPNDEDTYYYIELYLDGTTRYYKDFNGGSGGYELLSGIVDIVSFANGAGDVYVYDCYMLDKDGNVYKYKLSDLIDETINPVAEKLSINNVEKLIYVDWSQQQNAGGNWALLAITNDGNYVELVRAGV